MLLREWERTLLILVKLLRVAASMPDGVKRESGQKPFSRATGVSRPWSGFIPKHEPKAITY